MSIDVGIFNLKTMEWFVAIENKKNQRIKVTFLPEEEHLKFTGQYKPHNKAWVDFSTTYTSIDVNLQDVSIALSDTYELMNKRLEHYDNVSKGFSVITLIGVTGDETSVE